VGSDRVSVKQPVEEAMDSKVVPAVR